MFNIAMASAEITKKKDSSAQTTRHTMGLPQSRLIHN